MFGDYPSSMRQRVRDRLPKFTAEQTALIKGSLDFVGINHYTTYYARSNKTNIIGLLLNDALADSGTLTLRKSVGIYDIFWGLNYQFKFLFKMVF